MTILEIDELISGAIYLYSFHFPYLQTFFLIIGSLPVYALPIVLVYLFIRNRGADRSVAAKAFIGSILAWKVLSNAVGSLLYASYGFRDRPFSLNDMNELFFERPEKAFPSDHASVLMAVTLLFFSLSYRQLGFLFALGTILTAVGRIGSGFHYLGDILGGLVIGLIAYGIMRLIDRPLDSLLVRLRLRGKNEQA